MGFATVFSSIASGVVTNAVGLIDDLADPLSVVFGIAALALVLASLRRFLPS